MTNKRKDQVYDIVLWMATLGRRRKPAERRVLVVRLDEIGDYMLWHKFLQEIVEAPRFAGTVFHFCGNQSWESLFSRLEGPIVQKTSWLNKRRFKSDMLYRFRFLREIYRAGYDTVINPTFSRDKRYDDSIVRAAKAPNRIGMKANQETVRDYERGYDTGLYTELFAHPAKPLFEFFRNRLFAEFITGKPSPVTDTRVDTTLLPALQVALPPDYFIVFPGSRSAARIWPAGNFAAVAGYLHEKKGWTAIVCGAASDKPYTDAFLALYTGPVLDLTGQTTLPDMLSLFSKAHCLLSVDTGSVHLATAVGCAVFGIFNGSQYGRFAPYPAAMAPGFHAVYPDEVEKELADERMVAQKYEFVVPVPYADVSAAKLITAIQGYYRIEN